MILELESLVAFTLSTLNLLSGSLALPVPIIQINPRQLRLVATRVIIQTLYVNIRVSILIVHINSCHPLSIKIVSVRMTTRPQGLISFVFIDFHVY